MDADDELMEALPNMFTVVPLGLVVIMGNFLVSHARFLYALMLSVLAAFWAWGLIRVKMLNDRLDQMFSLMQIHVYEISSSLMLLLILLFYKKHDLANLQGMQTVPLFLVGLAITGYGMGVFFAGDPSSSTVFSLGDFGVYFITIGLILIVVVIAHHRRAHRDPTGRIHMAGVCLIVYILMLLVATYIAGD